MSLTAEERAKVMAQVQDKACPACGDELTAKDDGISTTTAYGVGGAYVSCDTCGHELQKSKS